jgi:hypothetical protein
VVPSIAAKGRFSWVFNLNGKKTQEKRPLAAIEGHEQEDWQRKKSRSSSRVDAANK